MQEYGDDFLLFVEAGFIAVNQADEDAALKLFKTAELLRPENTFPHIGLGYLHLHKLELKQSVEYFGRVLEKEPTNEMAKAFLGIATSMIPNQTTEGEKLLEHSLKSKDPSIKRLAGTAIDFVERFIKKPPGPAGKSR